MTPNQANQITKPGNIAIRAPSIIASPIIVPALICCCSIISPPVEFRLFLYVTTLWARGPPSASYNSSLWGEKSKKTILNRLPKLLK